MASLNKIELILFAFVAGCGSKAKLSTTYDSGVLAPDADTENVATVPEPLTTFAGDVRAASDAALGGSGPQVCSAAVPPIQVASSPEVDAAIVNYISAIVGVPATALAVSPQMCGDPNPVPCANIFQNDVAHFGGANAVTTYPLAQQLESTSTNVRVAIFSPTDAQGMGLPAIVVMSGVQDGWLMAIATFGDRTICR